MLWLKAFHVFAVISWFAGLLYLPRLFVYHQEATEPVVRERFKVMERRLFAMTNIGAALTLIFGLATLGWWIHHVPGYLASNHWLHAKLVLVVALYAYHGHLGRLMRQFASDSCLRSSRWLRVFNEVPAVLALGIAVLVIVKPF